MSLKQTAKSLLPPKARSLARGVYRLTKVPHYYLPYLFADGRARAPLQATFELTYRCNQNCVMCPLALEKTGGDSHLIERQKTEAEMPTDGFVSVVRELKDLGTRQITLTGGEPFLRKDVFEIAAAVKQAGLTCGILSNGTLIDEEKAARIVELGVDDLTFSLDGNQPTHDRIRNVPDAFGKLTRAVTLLNEEKKRRGSTKPHLAFSCTISAINADQLSQLMDIAHRHHVDMHYGYLYYTTEEMIEQTAGLIEIGGAKDENQDVDADLKDVDIDRLAEGLREVKAKQKRYALEATFQPPLKGDQVARRFHDDQFAYSSKCFYPWYAVRINPYGEVYPCSMAIQMGNIRKATFASVWNGAKFVAFRKKLKEKGLFPKCTKCCALNTKLWTYLPRI